MKRQMFALLVMTTAVILSVIYGVAQKAVTVEMKNGQGESIGTATIVRRAQFILSEFYHSGGIAVVLGERRPDARAQHTPIHGERERVRDADARIGREARATYRNFKPVMVGAGIGELATRGGNLP